MIKSNKNRIKKNNENFEKLSASEQRILIARDVLAQLAAGKYKAKSGSWVQAEVPGRNYNLITEDERENNADLKEVFCELESCNVCALGGMFVSAVKNFNKLKFNDLHHVKNYESDFDEYGICNNCGDREQDCNCADSPDGDICLEDIQDYMSKFFSIDQLKLIELAFEQGN